MPSEVSTVTGEQSVEALRRELAEAREQQAATVEILTTISGSVTDANQVFAKIAASAARLCDANDATIFQVDGDLLRRVANNASIPQYETRGDDTMPLTREVVGGRAVLDGKTVQVADVQAEMGEYPEGSHRARRVGHRTILAVPLMRVGEAIGVIAIRRTEVRQFADRQIDLLKTFADQAVIAIENARLFEAEQASKRELQESLEYQTAISDVLGVIGRSKFDLQPVLDTLVASAARLCNAEMVAIHVRHGDAFPSRARYGVPAKMVEALSTIAQVMGRGSLVGRTIAEGRPVHIPDAVKDPEYTNLDFTRITGTRSMLGVPLLRDGRPVGLLSLYRTRVSPFTDRQINLMATFSDQAVIAIENTRLFEAEQASKRELQEALQQQTATADVLKVISRSTFDLQTVLDTLTESAARLCHADKANIARIRGDAFQFVAFSGFETGYREYMRALQTSKVDRGSITGRTVLEGRIVHVPDVLADPEFTWFEAQKRGGYRTALGVPLLREGTPIGVFFLTRNKIEPFTPPQMELVTSFADQAVIAIENTRLFEAEQIRTKELQESLEYQTATSEVLGVISRSPDTLQPVLDGIVATALRLCDARNAAIVLQEGVVLRLRAKHGPMSMRTEWPVGNRSLLVSRAVHDCRTQHVHDLSSAGDEFPEGQRDAIRDGIRSILAVPLVRQERSIGTIVVRRTEVKPFTDRQIALLQTFADQAVIAINNVGLFEAEQASKRELTEALEQQTATADVLKVISRSALDLPKVLDALVESAARLCNAYDAVILQLFGDGLRLVAHHGQIPTSGPVGQLTFPLVRGLIMGRSVIDRRTIHVEDVLAEADEYPEGRKNALRTGWRTALAVPLVHAGEAIGVIFIRRAEVRPFTERQIELVNTFADQAVIAIENTRLFEEVQARTCELQEALEQQTATTDVLQVISSSPGELQPVFDCVLSNATRVCGANFGNLFLCEGAVFRHVAIFGAPPEFAEMRRGNPVVKPAPNSILDRITTAKQPNHILDFREEQSYLDQSPASVQLVEIAGARTVLGVPLISANKVIGIIAIYRRHVEAFTNKQIELVANFAKQAVIAIENARLFEAEQASKCELQESLEQQTATSELLKVIGRSTFDLQPVFKALAESAVKLCEAERSLIYRLNNDRLRLAASHNATAELIAFIERNPLPLERTNAAGRASVERRTILIEDVQTDPEYTYGSTQIDAVRSVLAIPMLRGDELLGVIVIYRHEVRPFTTSQIALMETFADQAMIAVENTRLFEEVQTRTRELAKTVEDLEIASQHKNRFVANMSHELRTPLAAILGYAELIQEGFYEPQGPRSLDALTRIRSNGKHLLGLINTVLDIAKIESGQFTLNMGEYAIESVVETVRAATESLAQNKMLTLTTSVHKSLPVGIGDEQRLTQVLLNLVGNAIKFTDVGEVSIAAGARNGHFTVSVTDTGPGIPPDQQDRIFEQFHQVDSSNTKAKGGTGLGLAIAKQIVEMHGGRIWVESMLGKGSTFQIELPTHAEFRKSTP